MIMNQDLIQDIRTVAFAYLTDQDISHYTMDYLEGSAMLLSSLFESAADIGISDQNYINNIVLCYGIITKIIEERKHG